MQTTFNPENKEHRIIIAAAIVAADAFGAGRLTAAREQLEMNDIRIADRDQFARCVFQIGQGIK